MIWAKEKTIIALVGAEEEEIKIRFRIPNAVEWADILDKYEKSVPWAELVKTFGIEVDGFQSMDEFVTTPGTGPLVSLVGSQILESAVPTVALKNA